MTSFGLFARAVAASRAWRWSRRSVAAIRADVRQDGLGVAVAPPPTTARGSHKAIRVALRRDRASCLERSLVIQRWWASRGVALDIIVGVRHPTRNDGPPAHAWVEHYDQDWSHTFSEIRRVAAPEGRTADELMARDREALRPRS